MPKSSKAKSTKSTTAGSDYGGSQSRYGKDRKQVTHTRESTCQSCQSWKGALKHILWETCLSLDPKETDCGNRPRRGGQKGGRLNICDSCVKRATRTKKSQAKTCRNPNSEIKDCRETPLETANSYTDEGGSMRGSEFYLETHAPEASTAETEVTEVTGGEFKDLLTDLDELDAAGFLDPQKDIDAFMANFDSQVNPDGSLKQ